LFELFLTLMYPGGNSCVACIRSNPTEIQHRALTRPFFHPTHVSPSLFIPHIERFLQALPSDGEPVDMQKHLGQLALEMAVMWLCGVDLGADDGSRGPDWEAAKNGLGEAMREGQRVLGRRVKIGTVWVGLTALRMARVC
jgi:hypothetical protein